MGKINNTLIEIIEKRRIYNQKKSNFLSIQFQYLLLETRKTEERLASKSIKLKIQGFEEEQVVKLFH